MLLAMTLIGMKRWIGMKALGVQENCHQIVEA
jgi:hypothetical protein